MRRSFITGALTVFAIAFIAIGVMRGEMGTVFIKATKICLECIGIG